MRPSTETFKVDAYVLGGRLNLCGVPERLQLAGEQQGFVVGVQSRWD